MTNPGAPPPPSAFLQAVELFNRREFFECHEVLEDIWRPLPPGPEKQFYQGVLQVGVGFHHLLNGNFTGAKNLLTAGLEKLQPLLGQFPFEDWMNLALFCQQSGEAVRILLTLGSKRLETFPLERIPRVFMASSPRS